MSAGHIRRGRWERPVAFAGLVDITSLPESQRASRRPRPNSTSVALVLGTLDGFIVLAVSLSFAALVYSGGASAHLVVGSALFLVGATVMNLVVAGGTSLPGAVVVPQDATTAVIAVSIAAILPQVDEPALLGTVLVYGLAATALTGIFMLALGAWRLGNLVRFIPNPVIGGFLAGTGFLLVIGGADLATAGFRWTAAAVLGLGGSVVLAVVLTYLLRLRPAMFTMPAIVAIAVVVFYLALWATGTSVSEARNLGLLPSAMPTGLSLSMEQLTVVDWGAVVSGISGLVTAPLVATLALLLNVTGLELVADRDADLNRELRVVGVANLLASPTGASAGYHSLGLGAIAFRLGVLSRWVTATCGLVCAVALLAGGTIATLLPTPVVGGLLLMIGLGFIGDWLIDGRRQMTTPEYLLMAALAAAVVLLGFLPAVLLGMGAAVALFAVAYSRVDPVRNVANGAERSSSHDRSPAERSAIAARAEDIVIVELQGYLFFGTARAVLDRARGLVASTPNLSTLVIDLRRVQGVDSTALASFVRLHRLATRNGFQLVLSDPPRSLVRAMERSEATSRIVEDLDRAIEMAEDHLLAEQEIAADLSSLAEVFGDVLWSTMQPHLRRIELEPGEVLADLEESSAGLFLVDRGRIAAEIPSGDARWQRVVSSGPGTILGEVSLYVASGRTARLVAEESTCVFTLELEAIRAIEESDPAMGTELHRRLAAVLAGRLATGNQMLRALLR